MEESKAPADNGGIRGALRVMLGMIHSKAAKVVAPESLLKAIRKRYYLRSFDQHQ